MASKRTQTAVLLATFLAALDGTVVATAGPVIARDLSGLNFYPWMLASFMAATAVATPVFGKLADRFPPSRLYTVVLGVFAVGSLGCAAAESIGVLIGFRIFQGIGAGGIFTVGLIVIGRAFTGPERAKALGTQSAMWGIAAVLGPVVGGLFAQTGLWRLMFLVNIPLILIAMSLVRSSGNINKGNEFRKDSTSKPFDFRGTLWLSLLVSTWLMTPTVFGAGLDWLALLAIVAGGISGVLFWKTESLASDPLLPLLKFRKSATLRLLVAGAISSAVLYATVTMISLLTQSAMNFSPAVSGLILLPIPAGWAVGSMAAGRRSARIGGRPMASIGLALMILGLLACSGQSARAWQIIDLAAGGGLLGFGTGHFIIGALWEVQTMASESEIGVDTALFNFARNVGNALGPAIFGGLTLWMDHGLIGIQPSDGLQTVPISGLLTQSIHVTVWILVAVLAVLIPIVAEFGPRKSPAETLR